MEVAIKLAKYYKVSLDYIAGLTNDKKGFNKSDLPSSEVELLKNTALFQKNGRLEY